VAGEPRLQIGQSHVIRPPIAADRSPVRATIVGAVNQKAAHAGCAHFGEGDFLAGDGGYEALKRGQREEENRVYRLRSNGSPLQPIEQQVNAREPPVGVWKFSNSEAAGGGVPIDRDGAFVCQIDGTDRDYDPQANG
jgi:hypothetical protein